MDLSDSRDFMDRTLLPLPLKRGCALTWLLR
jgi:hypothetical protein